MTPFAWVPAALMALLPGQAAPPTFPSATEVVRLDVLALEREAPLPGLTADDFEVRDNGVPQKIRLSRAASSHWQVVVVFDTSESVYGRKLEAFRECGRAIARSLRESDQAALVTFSDIVELRSEMTRSAAALAQALDQLRAGGGTALFDALFAALAISGTDAARPVVIVFTDGRDTVSWLSADDVLAAARRSEASIYAVSTSSIGMSPPSPTERPTWASVATTPDDEFLGRITKETGGRFLHASSGSGLQAQLAAVLHEISARYLITYDPVGVAKEGWHRVQVRLKRKRGAVVVRPGYFRPPARTSDP